MQKAFMPVKTKYTAAVARKPIFIELGINRSSQTEY